MSNSYTLCPYCSQQYPDGTMGDKCPDDGHYLVDVETSQLNDEDGLLGKCVGEEFAVVGVIGAGAFGTVYMACQMPIRRPTALKILHAQKAKKAEINRRFEREAKALAQLSDTNIVQLIRFGEDVVTRGDKETRFWFIAQEFVEGRTLRQILNEEGSLPFKRAQNLTRNILKALAAAHRKGIIHRDLKPGNIMVSVDALQNENVKVLDFGIAKLRVDNDQDEQTMAGTLLGTPNYMSPEQIRSEEISPATDLYAVGVLFYEMLSGKRPFSQKTKIDTLRAHLETVRPTCDSLPAPARPLVEKALALEPSERFTSARQMAAALDMDDSLASFVNSDAVESIDGNTIELGAHTIQMNSVSELEAFIEGPLQRNRNKLIVAIVAVALVAVGMYIFAPDEPEVKPPTTELKRTVAPAKKTPASVAPKLNDDKTRRVPSKVTGDQPQNKKAPPMVTSEKAPKTTGSEEKKDQKTAPPRPKKKKSQATVKRRWQKTSTPTRKKVKGVMPRRKAAPTTVKAPEKPKSKPVERKPKRIRKRSVRPVRNVEIEEL